MIQEAVVAQIPEERERDVLTAIHQTGLGHVARMIRSGRCTPLDQLRRAGIPISQAPDELQRCDSLLLVTAEAQSPMACSLVLRHGGNRAWTVTRRGEWTLAEDKIIAKPNVHHLPPHPAQLVPGLSPGVRIPNVRPAVAAADLID